MNAYIPSIVAMLICIIFSAYFSATETAFSSLNKTRLKALSEKGNKKADLALSLEENIEKTAAAVKILSAMNIGVEGEIGHIGSAADGVPTDYTTVEEAKRYVDGTGVSALAVAVGTAHGRYKQAPVLAIERIKEIKEAIWIPLVLHGGSGVPDDQIRASIEAGIRKVNFGTDLCYAFLDKVFERQRSTV